MTNNDSGTCGSESCDPIEQASKRQSPTQQSPTQQSPTQQSPTRQSPTRQSPTQQSPMQPASVQPESMPLNAQNSQLTIEIASDVICPWCFIGKRRFETALEKIDGENRERIKVIWRPFQLNPDMPKEGVERDEYRVRKFGSLEYSRQLDAQVADAGRGVGINFNHAAMRRTPNTFAAHRLMYLAHQLDRQDALAENLFDGYFCQGMDIGDIAVLDELAERSGMDRKRATEYLQSDEGANETRAEEVAVKALGIRGVPAFIAGGNVLFTGAQNPDTIVQALRQLL